MRSSETAKNNRFVVRSANSFKRREELLLFRLAGMKLALPASVCKTSKVTSYYLLPRLIVANEIPEALIEQVGNLLPNEVVFFSQTNKNKTTKRGGT